MKIILNFPLYRVQYLMKIKQQSDRNNTFLLFQFFFFFFLGLRPLGNLLNTSRSLHVDSKCLNQIRDCTLQANLLHKIKERNIYIFVTLLTTILITFIVNLCSHFPYREDVCEFLPIRIYNTIFLFWAVLF